MFGLWCFLFTAFACILGMVPKFEYASDPQGWLFQLASNIVTPIVLILLGMILPAIARREKKTRFCQLIQQNNWLHVSRIK